MTEMDSDAVEKALESTPDRPLSSLYDVATLYAACDTYERFTSEYIDWELSPDALQAMSPEAKADLFKPENDNSLIAARIDLTGDEPRLGDPAVMVENLTEELKYKVGFMARDRKTSNKTDYSISNHANDYEVADLAHDEWANRFLRGRLERWPFEVPDEVVEESPILQDLRELGNDTEAMERLEEELLESANFDSTECIVTIKLRVDEGEEYRYPGEVSQLNKAGVRRQYDHLRDGLSVDDAHGPGVGYVSSEEGEVLGGSPGIRGQYGKKQVERFPNMKHDDAWLSRPLTEAVALAVSNFDDLVGAFSFTRQGVRLHYLPYPVKPVNEDVFERFYTDVYQPLKQANDASFVQELLNIYTTEVDSDEKSTVDESPLADVIEDVSTYEAFDARDSWLRLYGLMYVGSTDPERVFVDEPSVDLGTLTALNDAYASVLAEVGASSQFGKIANQLEYLLPMEEGLIHAVMFGTFFERVTSVSPDPDDETDSNQRATSDDALFTRYAKILRGAPIATNQLLEEYVTVLERQFRQNQQEGNKMPFPTYQTVAQYIQLRSLDKTDILGGENIITKGINADTMAASESQEPYSTREERLEAFIDSHEMLWDDPARSVFLLGALVGRLAAYQYNEGISQKMTEQYPPSAVNRRSLPDITQDVLDRTYTYGDKDDRGRFNKRYTDRLADSMLGTHPDEWDLSESEVKWIYSLGVAYGKQDTSADINYDESDDE